MHQCMSCKKSFSTGTSLQSHQAQCVRFRRHRREQLENQKTQILDDYLVHKESLLIISQKYGFSYPAIKSYLESLGIDVKKVWHDPERSALRTERARQTSLKKYGVDNPSKAAHIRKKVEQTCMNRYGVHNGSTSAVSQIKHYILGMDVEPNQKMEYQQYKTTVHKLTEKNKKHLSFSGICFYSGVAIQRHRSINDDFRASIDHKIPVIIGFINKIPAEDIASVNNLVWCAKLLNTYKRTMTEEQFRASGIIERFKQYEGQLRNPT